MKKIQKKYSSIDPLVVEHVFNNVCGGNEDLTNEILPNMSQVEIRQLKEKLTTPVVTSKPSGMTVVKKKVAGLFDSKTHEKFSLKHVHHDIMVKDFTTEMISKQSFVNTKESPVEMIYRFPLISEISTIYHVKVDLYNPKTKERKTMVAKVKEKEKAQDKYDDSVSSGNSAMLMEKQEKENLVTLNLGNIKEGVEVDVNITSSLETQSVEETLEEEDDENESKILKMKVTIPSIYNTKETEDGEILIEKGIGGIALKNMSVNCISKIKFGEVSHIEFPNNKDVMNIQSQDGNDVIVNTSEDVAPVSDFEINIFVKKYPQSSCIIQKIPKLKEKHKFEYEYAGMISVIPRMEKLSEEVKISSEIIVIIDCSGSMSGSRMKNARESLQFFLQSLDPDDDIKINIIRFGSSYRKLFSSGPRKLTNEVLNQAMDYAKSTDSNLGGTDILSPCQHVLNTPISPGYSRQVWLITDGEDSSAMKIIKLVKQHSQNSRFMSVGIGRDINQFFLKEIARNSNGRACFISETKDINEKILRLLNYSLKPSIHNIELEFPAKIFGKVQNVTESIPIVYFNQNYIKYFFFEKYNLSSSSSNNEENIEMTYSWGGGSSGVSNKKTTHKKQINIKCLEEGEKLFISIFERKDLKDYSLKYMSLFNFAFSKALRGDEYNSRPEFIRALKYIEENKDNFDEKDYYIKRGVIKRNLKVFDESMNCFKEVSRLLGPDHFDVELNWHKAKLLQSQKKYQESFDLHEKNYKSNEYAVLTLIKMAEIKGYYMGKFTESMKYFEQVSKLNEFSYYLEGKRAKVYKRFGMIKESRDCIEKVKEMNPKVSNIYEKKYASWENSFHTKKIQMSSNKNDGIADQISGEKRKRKNENEGEGRNIQDEAGSTDNDIDSPPQKRQKESPPNIDCTIQ